MLLTTAVINYMNIQYLNMVKDLFLTGLYRTMTPQIAISIIIGVGIIRPKHITGLIGV